MGRAVRGGVGTGAVRLQQQSVPRWGGGHQHPLQLLRRALAALSRPDGVVQQPRDALHVFTAYEPLYAYHYLKRPYVLIPKAAEEVAKPHYLDKAGQPLPDDAAPEQIAESVYDVKLKKGILYAPHPAFAKNDKGEYLYHAMKPGEVGDKRSPWDFAKQGTRELVAEDYVYAFKRHATTRIEAPIFAVFSEYVIGLKVLGADQDRGCQAAQGPARVQRRQALPRLPPLAAGRRDRAGQPHGALSHQGQVPAVEVLAGDDLLVPGAVGGRRLLFAAWHECQLSSLQILTIARA